MKPLTPSLRQAIQLALGFGYMVLLIEAIRTAVAWWRSELVVGLGDGLLLTSLPLLAWIWWRYLSPFGCRRGTCLSPPEHR